MNVGVYLAIVAAVVTLSVLWLLVLLVAERMPRSSILGAMAWKWWGGGGR